MRDDRHAGHALDAFRAAEGALLAAPRPGRHLPLDGGTIPRERLAHVWGDNFDNDGSNRDLTFLPRTSHETITWGSSGVFTTAEELARWSHALFHGELISRASLRRDIIGIVVGHLREAGRT